MNISKCVKKKLPSLFSSFKTQKVVEIIIYYFFMGKKYQGIEEDRGLFKYGGNHELVEKRG
jgi:hypothetical protein